MAFRDFPASIVFPAAYSLRPKIFSLKHMIVPVWCCVPTESFKYTQGGWDNNVHADDTFMDSIDPTNKDLNIGEFGTAQWRTTISWCQCSVIYLDWCGLHIFPSLYSFMQPSLLFFPSSVFCVLISLSLFLFLFLSFTLYLPFFLFVPISFSISLSLSHLSFFHPLISNNTCQNNSYNYIAHGLFFVMRWNEYMLIFLSFVGIKQACTRCVTFF